MSRDMSDLPINEAVGRGNRLVSEPAFELLFSEIISYTGAYVAQSAASHAVDNLRSTTPGNPDEVDNGGTEGVESSGNDGLILEPSPSSVGAGNAMFPVRESLELDLELCSRDRTTRRTFVQHPHETCSCRTVAGWASRPFLSLPLVLVVAYLEWILSCSSPASRGCPLRSIGYPLRET